MRSAIFDLDGTLADTAADLLAAANRALEPAGLPPLDYSRDKSFAGRGGRSMIRRSIELSGRDPNDASEIERTDNLYPRLLAAYENSLADQTTLYPGVVECLDQLEKDGWLLGVCTNKPERMALSVLDALGIRERFGAILGADTLPVRKPNPEHLRETARRVGGDPALAIMIGDTSTDINTARAAGVPVMLTSFGFAAEPLASLNPDAVVHHFNEIPQLLQDLSGRLCGT